MVRQFFKTRICFNAARRPTLTARFPVLSQFPGLHFRDDPTAFSNVHEVRVRGWRDGFVNGLFNHHWAIDIDRSPLWWLVWLITATIELALPREAAEKPYVVSHLRSGDAIAFAVVGLSRIREATLSGPLNEMIHISCGTIACAFLFVGVSMTASAQFKETPPAPYPPAVARQKIRTLLESVDPNNGQQTADTLSGLLVWYRDIVDDELIAAWRGDQRAKLPTLMPLNADSRVASAIVEFSWREQRASTFNLTYAPMLGDLMARYPNAADPFIRDLAGPVAEGGHMPDLSPSEADAVCRILLDMPDTGNWKKIALQVLPHYRPAAQNLLVQDLRGSNKEESYRAQRWLAELGLNAPGITSDEGEPRRRLIPRTSAVTGPGPTGNQLPTDTFPGRPHIVEQPSAPLTSSAAPSDPPYSAPSSGTLKCAGDPVLPNAEYVFPGMPLGNLQIDLDGKPWDARLRPGNGQTQDLILINRSSSPQKQCTVRWRIVPSSRPPGYVGGPAR